MENFIMDYYKYWEKFVALWYEGNIKAIEEWTNPDEAPALCNTNGGKKSSLYIPEPWWGNDGKEPLHSVVINFNPGGGGDLQERERVPYHGSYADDIVNYKGEPNPQKWPNNTAGWHLNRRATPVLNLLGLEPSLGSHLSIELIPWHTKDVDKKNYLPYLERNIKAVYKYSICFAAYKSKHIINGNLQNVVLLKLSGSFTKKLLKMMEKKGCCRAEIVAEGCVDSEGKYLEFKLEEWPDIRFISIWGKNSRNNFPVSRMKEIFTELNLLP